MMPVPASLLLVLVACAGAVSGQELLLPKSKPLQAPQSIPIYANGSFFGSWRDNSVGCIRCNHESVQQRRNGSTASLSAVVQPWGALTLASSKTEFSDSILDFYVKGSGLTSIALYIKDTASKTLSREVRFQSASQLKDGVTVLDNDDDGFIHIQVALSALRAGSGQVAASSNGSLGVPQPAAAASACGASGVSAHFDRIVFADVSGMGFTLVLDDVKLLSKDVIAASSLLLPAAATATKAPVFADDLTSLKAGKNRYIVKLKRNQNFSAVQAICSELAGQVAEPNRFTGLCNTPLSTLRNANDSLSWGLVTVTVASPADLQRMREALSSHIEYFEADLTGFTTIRALNEAASGSKGAAGFNLTAQPAVAADASMPAERPSWARQGDDELLSWVDRSRAEEVPPPARFQVPAQQSPRPATNVSAGNTTATNSTVVDLIGGNTTNIFNSTGLDTGVAGDSGASVDPITGVPLNNDQTASLPARLETAEGQAAIVSVSSWGLDRLNQVDLPLDGSYSSGDYDGRGVHVYVLDTGVRATHNDFKGRVGAGASAVGSSVADDQGHGTHVAGTVLGCIHGVAPSAILHPVKVMDAQGNGAFSNIIAGIQWAKDHKLRNNIASAVISMSIAGPRSASLNDAVEAAVAAGITVVTAAGNNKGGSACSMSPASAPSVITVGASTDSDTMASMSNIGTCVSLFAPGSYIASASFRDDSSEVYMSGTSMATPHVAGAAALYLQYRPGAPPAEVKAALTKAAVGRFFESTSPQLLLNVMSSRLRAQFSPSPLPPVAPKPSSPPSPSPKPRAVPSPSPAVVRPSPSPSPTPPLPPPSAPTFITFPSSTLAKPAICSTCKWCTLMCS